MALRTVCVAVASGRQDEYPIPHGVYQHEGITYYGYLIESEKVENALAPTGAKRISYDLDRQPYGEIILKKLKRISAEPAKSMTWLDQLQFTPDPDATLFCLACIVGTIIPDENAKVWGMLWGPASSGKTVTLNLFDDLVDAGYIKYLDYITPARMRSEDQKKPSPLREINNGATLIIKDLGSLLSHNRQDYDSLMNMLRRIYDGEYSGSTMYDSFEWRGKVGMLLAATVTMYRKGRWMSEMGERFLYYRIDSQVKDLVGKLNLGWLPKKLNDLPSSIEDVLPPWNLTEIAECIAVLRASDVDSIEVPHRIVYQLKTLYTALKFLDVENRVVRRVVANLIDSSMLHPYRPLLINRAPPMSKNKMMHNYPLGSKTMFERAFRYLRQAGLLAKTRGGKWFSTYVNPLQ